jgi:hypothetical protein
VSFRSDAPDVYEVLDAILAQRDEDSHTCFLARVQSYDAGAQEATVVPVVKHAVAQPDGSTTYEPLPALPHVPIAHPRSGGWFVALPIVAGSYVVVHVLDAAHGAWRAGDGAAQVPGDLRRRTLGNVVAYPVNFYPRGQALANAPPTGGGLVIGNDDGTRLEFKADGSVVLTQGGAIVLHIDTGGIVHLGAEAGASFVALATDVQTALNAIFTWATTHTHSVPLGPGTSGVAAPVLGSLGPVAATKAKAT